MVSASRTEGGPQILSAGVRKTIQSIKEIVGNHSDAEIYVTLRETNMDPNETAQKLLNQDPFHEVKRKRDKRKEVTTYLVHTASQPRVHTEHLNQGQQVNTYTERMIRRGGFVRNSLPDAKVSSREFRVVRDNRTNHNTNNEIKPPLLQGQISANEVDSPKFSEKSNPVALNNQKQPLGRHSSQSSNLTDLQPRQERDIQLSDKKDTSEGKPLLVSKAGPQIQIRKANDSQLNSTTSSNNSVAGVYSSSSDPVHVPSPDSRPAANIGAIKREVGAVGRRLSTESSPKIPSAQSGSSPNSHLGHDGPSRDSLRSSTATSKSSQPNQAPVHESATQNNSVSRPMMSNHYVSRQHQTVGHQKASSRSNKEWKPKSSQKQSSGPGIIGTPAKSSPPSVDTSKNLEVDSTQLQDKLLRIKVAENHVIISPHIRVSETDRYRVTFGSLGTELEPSRNPVSQAVEVAEETHINPSPSILNATPESSGDESSGSKQVELLDERVGNSGTSSPASAAVSEQQLTERKESSSPQNLNNYADVRLVRDSSRSYTPSESQQQQDPPQLPIFSAYEAQTMYDIPYFRSTVDETARVQNLQFPQEALSSHTVRSIPASTIAMVQQQQTQQLAQIYPQVHVSHYANLVPYRQFVSPFYVPPMAVPGYSSNAAYPHPSNGNSYLLMPGGSSHLSANGVKYGIQQFKPVPTGSPAGFGSFPSPTGYTINAPGVGSAAGIEDSSGVKFKDRNLYVPNPQAETSEIWMSSRDLPSMQSGSFYNIPGQTPHASYLPSHTSHASFNAAAQSSHMQFPGMYHPPQPAGIPSPHHLSPAIGGNVGVGVAAGGPVTQVNAYQQSQLGHMNWTGNF